MSPRKEMWIFFILILLVLIYDTKTDEGSEGRLVNEDKYSVVDYYLGPTDVNPSITFEKDATHHYAISFTADSLNGFLECLCSDRAKVCDLSFGGGYPDIHFTTTDIGDEEELSTHKESITYTCYDAAPYLFSPDPIEYKRTHFGHDVTEDNNEFTHICSYRCITIKWDQVEYYNDFGRANINKDEITFCYEPIKTETTVMPHKDDKSGNPFTTNILPFTTTTSNRVKQNTQTSSLEETKHNATQNPEQNLSRKTTHTKTSDNPENTNSKQPTTEGPSITEQTSESYASLWSTLLSTVTGKNDDKSKYTTTHSEKNIYYISKAFDDSNNSNVQNKTKETIAIDYGSSVNIIKTSFTKQSTSSIITTKPSPSGVDIVNENKMKGNINYNDSGDNNTEGNDDKKQKNSEIHRGNNVSKGIVTGIDENTEFLILCVALGLSLLTNVVLIVFVVMRCIRKPMNSKRRHRTGDSKGLTVTLTYEDHQMQEIRPPGVDNQTYHDMGSVVASVSRGAFIPASSMNISILAPAETNGASSTHHTKTNLGARIPATAFNPLTVPSDTSDYSKVVKKKTSNEPEALYCAPNDDADIKHQAEDNTSNDDPHTLYAMAAEAYSSGPKTRLKLEPPSQATEGVRYATTAQSGINNLTQPPPRTAEHRSLENGYTEHSNGSEIPLTLAVGDMETPEYTQSRSDNCDDALLQDMDGSYMIPTSLAVRNEDSRCFNTDENTSLQNTSDAEPRSSVYASIDNNCL